MGAKDVCRQCSLLRVVERALLYPVVVRPMNRLVRIENGIVLARLNRHVLEIGASRLPVAPVAKRTCARKEADEASPTLNHRTGA